LVAGLDPEIEANPGKGMELYGQKSDANSLGVDFGKFPATRHYKPEGKTFISSNFK